MAVFFLPSNSYLLSPRVYNVPFPLFSACDRVYVPSGFYQQAVIDFNSYNDPMKHLRTILIFLLLGAVVNVSVAWGIVLFVDVIGRNANWSGGAEIVGNESWALSRWDSFGSMLFESERARGEFSSLVQQSVAEFDPPSHISSDWAPLDVLTDEYVRAESQDGQLVEELQRFEARGWPLLAFWCVRGSIVHAEEDIIVAPRGFIETSLEEPYPSGRPKVLPFLPIWRGIVINSVFYGGPLWLGFITIYGMVRIFRYKLGKCRKCGYDLRGAEHKACPECGHTC